MENNKGLKRILKIAGCYSFLQQLTYKKSALQLIVYQLWRVEAGMKVVDIGCGPGETLNRLSEKNIDYLGFDLNSQYIARAEEDYGDRGRFFCGTCEDFMEDSTFDSADLIMCNGVMHHLSDQDVISLIRFANRHAKKDGGRFVALEPVNPAASAHPAQ